MNLFTHKIISVTPMRQPIGLAYAMRYMYSFHPDIYTNSLYYNGSSKNKLCWYGKNNPLKVNIMKLKIKNRNKRIYKWLTKE